MLKIRKLKLRGFQGDYTGAWFVRAYLLARVRGSGVSALPVRGLGARTLSNMAPDRNRWMWRLTHQRAGTRQTVSQVLQEVGCRGPFELFSMWVCLCNTVDPDAVVGREHELADACRSFEATHGWKPHPSLLVKGCL